MHISPDSSLMRAYKQVATGKGSGQKRGFRLWRLGKRTDQQDTHARGYIWPTAQLNSRLDSMGMRTRPLPRSKGYRRGACLPTKADDSNAPREGDCSHGQ